MDIGNQQRVIIVEPDQAITEAPAVPAPAGAESTALENAVTWPLPLDLELETEPIN